MMVKDRTLKKPPYRKIHTNIAGVTFYPIENFENLKLGEKLILVPEPFNKHDPHAVKITRDTPTAFGTQLGHVKAKYGLAYDIGQAIKKGKTVTCEVSALTGDWTWSTQKKDRCTPTKDMFGVNITLTIE